MTASPRGLTTPPAGTTASDPARRFGIAAPEAASSSGASGSRRSRPNSGGEKPPGRWRRLPRWQRVLLLIGMALLLLGAGYLVRLFTTPTVEALRLVHGVHAGAAIKTSNLETVPVPAGAGGVTPVTERGQLVGKTARSDLPAGTLLTATQVSDHDGLPKQGQVRVGLSLKPGQLPAEGLDVGDRVGVVAPPGGEGAAAVVLVRKAPVWAVREHKDSVTVTLLVHKGKASRLGAYAVSGPVSVLHLSGTGG